MSTSATSAVYEKSVRRILKKVWLTWHFCERPRAEIDERNGALSRGHEPFSAGRPGQSGQRVAELQAPQWDRLFVVKVEDPGGVQCSAEENC